MIGALAVGLIRSLGVTIEERDGSLALRPARPEAVEIAKANKPGILGQLRAEKFDGKCYASSGYMVWCERVYDAAHRVSDIAQCANDAREIKTILMEIDRAFEDGYAQGVSKFDSQLARIRECATRIAVATGYMLEGVALEAAVRVAVAQMGRDVGALA